MAEKNDLKLNGILLFVLTTKVLWVLSLFSHFAIKHYFTGVSYYLELNENIEYMLHNLFTFALGILMIYLFNHLTPDLVCIKGHSKFYLYSFGILSIIGILHKVLHKYVKRFDKLEDKVEDKVENEL